MLLVFSFAQASVPTPLYGQTESGSVDVQKAVLVLHPHGFEPPALTLKPGLTAIYVYNRVGLPELALRLDQEVKDQDPQKPSVLVNVRQQRVARERLKWRDVLDLPAGEYQVREEHHPKWVCTLKVEPGKR